MKIRGWLTVSATACLLGPTNSASAQTFTDVIRTGDLIPGDSGVTMADSNLAVSPIVALNDLQELALAINTNVGSATLRGRPDSLTTALLTGEATPVGSIVTSQTTAVPALANSGLLGINVLESPIGISSSRSTFLTIDRDGNVLQPIREGTPGPGGDELFVFSQRMSVAINDAGQAALSHAYFGGTTTDDDDQGIARWNTDSQTLEFIVRSDDPVPGGAGNLRGTAFQSSQVYDTPAINASGSVAFIAALADAPFNRDEAIYRYDDTPGGGRLVEIARTGNLDPAGGTYGNLVFNNATLNDRGQVAFAADRNMGSNSRDGVFVSDGVTARTIALNGDPMPGFVGTRTLQTFGRLIDLNNAGDVLFTSSNGSAMILDRANAADVTLAVSGDPLPDRAGAVFNSFSDFGFSLNESGEVAFASRVGFDGAPAGEGLFRYRPGTGVETIILTGDPLFGSTLVDLTFSGDPADERSGLNNRGDLAFSYELANGAQGVAFYGDLVATVSGDFNGSGLVEQGDLNFVLNTWGDARGPWANATGFTTTLVDQEELNAVLNNWGSSSSPNFAANPSVVPEPSVFGLLGLGLAGMLRRRR
ncbi:MAG: choice-of-anchor tandem repeat NxxGxxAF-containing protein [Planctomycetota bacterium]